MMMTRMRQDIWNVIFFWNMSDVNAMKNLRTSTLIRQYLSARRSVIEEASGGAQ